MKIPSEAELIEMERRAESVMGGREDWESEYAVAADLLRVLAVLKRLAPADPIPVFAPWGDHAR